jgi:uncharacterized protein (DUF2126 family)
MRPLTFDIHDTWSGRRSIGGCTYHVAHPGRPQLRHACRSTPTRPKRGAEPASSPFGHTGGRSPEPRPLDNPEHPLTLDLRRAEGL